MPDPAPDRVPDTVPVIPSQLGAVVFGSVALTLMRSLGERQWENAGFLIPDSGLREEARERIRKRMRV